jgi:hypothetical protein
MSSLGSICTDTSTHTHTHIRIDNKSKRESFSICNLQSVYAIKFNLYHFVDILDVVSMCVCAVVEIQNGANNVHLFQLFL